MVIIFLLVFLLGCAVPPKAVTLSEVAVNPGLYRDTAVQFSGLVKENKYVETTLGSWELLITDGQNELYCFKLGYDRSLLRHGVKLAEEARGEEGVVAVTGKLTPQEMRTSPTLEIQKLAYKGKSVDVETADYPDYYYNYPGYYFGPPFYYPGYPFYYFGHSHHLRFHRGR